MVRSAGASVHFVLQVFMLNCKIQMHNFYRYCQGGNSLTGTNAAAPKTLQITKGSDGYGFNLTRALKLNLE